MIQDRPPRADRGLSPMLSAVHVLAGVAREGAGPSVSVPSLCRALASLDVSTSLACVAGWDAPRGAGAADSLGRLAGVDYDEYPHDFAHTPVLRRLCCSRALHRGLRQLAAEVDVIHAHGLWLMPSVYPSRAVSRPGARACVVLSPRGMLAPAALQFSRGRKQAFWRLVQRGAVQAAACLHATSEAERDDIRSFGFDAPVAVVPNGVDLPDLSQAPQPVPGAGRTVLSLGRLHPKKGLDRLVRAWALIERERPGWRLRIVGPAEGRHDAELRALAAALGLSRVSIEGPLFGADKLAAYRSADLFVLPTLNENFAMTVAEALAAGTPVISTKGAPWAGLEAERCGWWIGHGAEAMAAALRRATALPQDELRRMGERGRVWMGRDFGWTAMAEKMAAVYGWIAGAGERPSHVHLA